jgi:predicted transcriptional regulator
VNDQHTTVAEDEDRVDATVLLLLLDETHPIWHTEEIGREIGDPLAASDAIARLHAAGLVHRVEPFVLATRAARHSTRIGQ